MKHSAIGGAFAIALLATTGMAVAQTVGTTTTTTTTIPAQQRTTIQEYVVTQQRPSVTIENVEVRQGVVLPPTVEFYSVPKVDNYRYTIVNDRRVVVDPSTRRVIEVLE